MWANAGREGGRERISRVYGALIWGVQLMNHPEHREQKRDDPDSFFLFASDSLSFSLSLSRNSCKITICTVYTHFFSLRLSRTHTLLNTPRHWKTCTPSLATHWAPLTSHNTLGYSCSKVIVLNRQTTSLRVVRSEAPPWDCKTRENVHLPLQKQYETHTPQGFHHIKKPL